MIEGGKTLNRKGAEGAQSDILPPAMAGCFVGWAEHSEAQQIRHEVLGFLRQPNLPLNRKGAEGARRK